MNRRKPSARKPVILDRLSLKTAEAYLVEADPILGRVIETHGPCTLCAGREDPFEQLCVSIIGQQLSVKAAHTIRGRVLALTGSLTPEKLLEADPEALRAAGLSRPKIRYIRALSEMVDNGELALDSLTSLPGEQVLAELLKVPGIGQWTAEMFMLFNLRHSDVLALGDAGLHRAVKKLYGPKHNLQKAGKKWRPYSSVASWYLWQFLDANLLGQDEAQTSLNSPQ